MDTTAVSVRATGASKDVARFVEFASADVTIARDRDCANDHPDGNSATLLLVEPEKFTDIWKARLGGFPGVEFDLTIDFSNNGTQSRQLITVRGGRSAGSGVLMKSAWNDEDANLHVEGTVSDIRRLVNVIAGTVQA